MWASGSSRPGKALFLIQDPQPLRVSVSNVQSRVHKPPGLVKSQLGYHTSLAILGQISIFLGGMSILPVL